MGSRIIFAIQTVAKEKIDMTEPASVSSIESHLEQMSCVVGVVASLVSQYLRGSSLWNENWSENRSSRVWGEKLLRLGAVQQQVLILDYSNSPEFETSWSPFDQHI